MNSELGALQTALAVLAEIPAWQIVAVITAAGTISMAILQVIKELTPLRRIYQRHWISKWISSHTGAGANSAVVLLEDLATGGSERALYELTAEQLVAQMNAAAQAALDYPRKYASLVIVLSKGADKFDVKRVLSAPPKLIRSNSEQAKNFLEARNRVAHRIQRNLDGIQIALSSDWRFWMQFASISLSTLLIEAAVISASGGFRLGTVLVTLPIGIVGGYFAPVTRDLVAALQTLRKP